MVFFAVKFSSIASIGIILCDGGNSLNHNQNNILYTTERCENVRIKSISYMWIILTVNTVYQLCLEKYFSEDLMYIKN